MRRQARGASGPRRLLPWPPEFRRRARAAAPRRPACGPAIPQNAAGSPPGSSPRSLSFQDLQPGLRPGEPALRRLGFDYGNKWRTGIDRKQPVPHAPAGIAQAIIGIANTLELLGRTVRRMFLHLAHVSDADLFFAGILVDAQDFCGIHYFRLPFLRPPPNPAPGPNSRFSMESRDSPRWTSFLVSSNSILAISGGMSGGSSVPSRIASKSTSPTTSSKSSNGPAASPRSRRQLRQLHKAAPKKSL